MSTTASTSGAIADRVHALEWPVLAEQLDDHGFAITPKIFTGEECRELAGLFDGDGFRSTIDMARIASGTGATATSRILYQS